MFRESPKELCGSFNPCYSGYALLQDWLDSRYNESSYTLDASGKDGITSPAKNVVEDELVQAFARLDLQLMSFIDPRPPKIHQNLLAKGQSTIDNMPKTFTSIDEARIYLELIQRRNSRLVMVFAAHTANNRKFGTASLDLGISAAPCTFYTESHFSVSIAEPGHPNFWPEGHRGMMDLRYWFAAFEPLYASVHRNTRSWTSASTLKMQAQSAKLSFIAATFSDECSIDRFLPDFRAMVDLGNEIAKDRVFAGQNVFCFDAGIMSSLRLVCRLCRQPKVRRDAIALMRRVGATEGLFNASMLANISEWVMNYEEEGMDENGWIPESERVKNVEMAMVGKRSARCKYVKIGMLADGRQDFREMTFKW
jgi:hypothetical protein